MKKNIYLEALTPVSLQKNKKILGSLPGSRRVRFGDSDKGKIYISTMACNATRMPPRIYAACNSGGGIVKDRRAARALQGRGFSVLETTITPDELSYMQAESGPTWRDIKVGDKIWLMDCNGETYRDPSLPGNWQWRCRQSGQGEGTEIVERVPVEQVGDPLAEGESHVDQIVENNTTGSIERADFDPALEYLPDEAIAGSILVGSESGFIPAPAVLRRALECAVYFAKLSASQSRLSVLFNMNDPRVNTRFLSNLVAQNAITLGKIAQPVWVLYNSDFMSPAVRRQMDDEATMGGTQMGRGVMPDPRVFGLAGDTPGWSPGKWSPRLPKMKGWKIASRRVPITSAIIALSGAAAVMVCADALETISAQFHASIEGERALWDDMVEVANDPDTPPEVREAILEAMKNFELTSPSAGLGEIKDIIKYGALAAAGVGVLYVFGPAITAGVKASAKRKQRQAQTQQRQYRASQQQRKRRQQQQRKKQKA